jgi:hypothetical protein
VSGGPGDDYIEGGGEIFGGPGRDSIYQHADGVIDPGLGADTVDVYRGNQRIRARDASPDIISCSGARYRETVLADGLDVYADGCEDWRRRGAARAVPTDLSGYYDNGSLLLHRTFDLTIACPHDGADPCEGRAAISVPGGRMLPAVPFRVARGRQRFISVRIPAGTRSRFAYRLGGADGLEGRNVPVIVWSRDRQGVTRSVRTSFWLYLEGVGGGE